MCTSWVVRARALVGSSRWRGSFSHRLWPWWPWPCSRSPRERDAGANCRTGRTWRPRSCCWSTSDRGSSTLDGWRSPASSKVLDLLSKVITMRAGRMPPVPRGAVITEESRMTKYMIAPIAATLLTMVGCDGQQKQASTNEINALKAQLDDRSRALEESETARRAAELRARTAEQAAAELAVTPVAAAPVSEGAAEEFNGIEGVSAEKVGDDIHVVIEGDVLFDSGKSTLKVASKRSLDRIVTIIKESHAGRSLDVVGYTDTDPIKATKDRFPTNYHLGFERAFAVREYLIAKGLSKDAIKLSSWGPEKPADTKARSRRVEVIVLGGAG
ncbi:MAG: OmpA family protein [Phycisphaerae bacterium]|nr:OmpA family protein [Phycisphaerae bacterium]